MNGGEKFYDGAGLDSSEIRIEYAKLENHQLPTITDECLEFLDDVDEDEITQATLNVQSLKCHKGDIETDAVLRETRLLRLTET